MHMCMRSFSSVSLSLQATKKSLGERGGAGLFSPEGDEDDAADWFTASTASKGRPSSTGKESSKKTPSTSSGGGLFNQLDEEDEQEGDLFSEAPAKSEAKPKKKVVFDCIMCACNNGTWPSCLLVTFHFLHHLLSCQQELCRCSVVEQACLENRLVWITSPECTRLCVCMC